MAVRVVSAEHSRHVGDPRDRGRWGVAGPVVVLVVHLPAEHCGAVPEARYRVPEPLLELGEHLGARPVVVAVRERATVAGRVNAAVEQHLQRLLRLEAQQNVHPELSADLVDRGIVVAGGGALVRGIDQLIAEETGLPVHIADSPLTAVAEGTGRVLQELQFLRRVASSSGE